MTEKVEESAFGKSSDIFNSGDETEQEAGSDAEFVPTTNLARKKEKSRSAT